MTHGGLVSSAVTNESRMTLRVVWPQIDHFCARTDFSEVQRFFAGEANRTTPLLVMDDGMRKRSIRRSHEVTPARRKQPIIYAPIITSLRGRFDNVNGDK